jgi:hypothetical protein
MILNGDWVLDAAALASSILQCQVSHLFSLKWHLPTTLKTPFRYGYVTLIGNKEYASIASESQVTVTLLNFVSLQCVAESVV